MYIRAKGRKGKERKGEKKRERQTICEKKKYGIRERYRGKAKKKKKR